MTRSARGLPPLSAARSVALDFLVASLHSDDTGFCGLCVLTILARACSVPGATLDTVVDSAADWLHRDYGPVVGSAFEVAARGERHVLEATCGAFDSVEELLGVVPAPVSEGTVPMDSFSVH